LLARYTSDQLARDAVETMELSRVEGDIAYAIAFGHMGTSVVLDNLRFGAQASTTTGEYGEYSLPLLPAGSYRVNIVSPTGWSVTTASGPTIATTLASGATVTGLDFGLRQSDATWQNPANRYDTNNDGFVSPIDALLIINVLNAEGAHPLEAGVTPAMPYIDVNADSFVSPIDALHVINELNRAVGSGEHAAAGESTSSPMNAASFVVEANAGSKTGPEAMPPSSPLVASGEATLVNQFWAAEASRSVMSVNGDARPTRPERSSLPLVTRQDGRRAERGAKASESFFHRTGSADFGRHERSGSSTPAWLPEGEGERTAAAWEADLKLLAEDVAGCRSPHLEG
ncbi:MAG: hypothetical protein KDA62_11725, partial [Planctomycetales bacterium]|nr:hypothetical protein [Planctomycetales bacterium]